MRRASETEFPKFDSPVMLDREAKYVAEYTVLSPSPLLLSSVLNFEIYDKITVRLLHNGKNI